MSPWPFLKKEAVRIKFEPAEKKREDENQRDEGYENLQRVIPVDVIFGNTKSAVALEFTQKRDLAGDFCSLGRRKRLHLLPRVIYEEAVSLNFNDTGI